MKLLFTADWQADVGNLDSCEIALQELLAAADKLQPDCIIHLGDLKEAYSPVSVFVVKFWARAVERITRKHKLIVLNGNHDRVSQTSDAENWLDIFRGADTIDTPCNRPVGDGVVFCLPYTSDKKQEAQWAAELWEKAQKVKKPKILIFHTDIFGAQMNSAGVKSTGVTSDSLNAFDYDASFGGHLHLYQRLGTQTWYCGSPFAQDWGEANVEHGHLYVEVGTGGPTKIQRIKSHIPNWYTMDWLQARRASCGSCNGTGFVQGSSDGQRSACPRCTPEKGAYIRSQVQVSSKKILAQLQKEEKAISEAFGDVRSFVVPKLKQPERLEVELSGATDRDQIDQYVAATIPEAAKYNAQRVGAYMVTRLAKTQLRARCGQLRVIKMAGANVLSFKSIDIKYAKQGLVYLKGVNKDWPKHSNGAGKTNALSMLPVAWFGETFKGQSCDAWANERTDGPTTAVLVLRDEAGRRIEIIRGRRPHRIELYIDGKDVSQGLTGKRKQETQSLIVQATGYDLHMLKNSIYIDQTIANGFVFGTQKDRMDLVNKLCSLERYDAALKLVGEDAKSANAHRVKLSARYDLVEQGIRYMEKELSELTSRETPNTEDLTTVIMAGKKAIAALEKQLGKIKPLSGYEAELTAAVKEETSYRFQQTKLGKNEAKYKAFLSKAMKLVEAGNCPTCGQPAKDVGAEKVALYQSALKEIRSVIKDVDKAHQVAYKRCSELSDVIQRLEHEQSNIDNRLEQERYKLAHAERMQAEWEKVNSRVKDKIRVLTGSIRKEQRILQAVSTEIAELEITQSMYDYAKKAFSRSGMPMYLAASLCPLLNKAAEDYSEVFTGGLMKVEFAVVDGEFTVNVINAAGSETAQGQSVGESAMAGVVAAFALREAAPKTNLLILDEPGHGLDEEGARAFANGLVSIKGRWETVLCTSHTPAIEAALIGEAKIWTVEKQEGTSRLLI